jgi:glutathione peroxidase-family protein/DNA-directed RNA polymerase subunit RPC12/RpoP
MPPKMLPKTMDEITDILIDNDCELISFEKNRRVKYTCSCKNIAETDSSNIRRKGWGGCAKCSNHRRGNIKDYEYCRKIWKEGGETLPEQNYTGNKDKMFYTCSNCNKEAHVSLSEFKRGRRCEQCRRERAEVTNTEIYGAPNPFQSEEIKEKIKETKIAKYGVDHHMKVPEILQKAKDTNMEKYGHAFSFHSKESFEKIRKTCIERYGYAFPLQSKEIQEKIHTTCMSRYGMPLYEYLQSEECRVKADETCMSRYGMPLYEYMQTEECREKSRETCMERYGVEYPMQNEEIFNKMLESSNPKEYVFPSGRIELCQGYEPMCFDLLLKDGYKEDDLVVGYKGRVEIWYDNPDTGNRSRYFPDGFILSDNAILEVKSEYYFMKEYDKNIAKFKAATAIGLNVHV